MGKLAKIKQAIERASDNDATKAIKYLLWYIESQDKELTEVRVAYRRIAHSGEVESNFSNWIGTKRGEVDEDKISPKEYSAWLKIADENDKYIVVAGKKVPKDP